MRRWRRPLALLPVALLLAGCAQSLFYYPDSVLYGTPARAGLSFDPVMFASGDGTALAGWFIPATGMSDPRGARGTVIHFHGNAQNMSSHWQYVGWLPERGYNVFVFDYRGYGASAGRPSARGLFEDSNAALDYLRSRPDVDPQRLLVLGQSLGGANAIAAIGAGNRHGIRAIAIEATFSSYAAIAHEKFFGAGWLMDDRYSPERYIERLAPLPLLLLHGSADAVIPAQHSRRLHARAREPKTLVLVEGGGHTEALTPRYGARYRDLLIAFYEAALAAPRSRFTGRGSE